MKKKEILEVFERGNSQNPPLNNNYTYSGSFMSNNLSLVPFDFTNSPV